MSERSLILATSGNDGVKTWSWRDNKLYGRDHFNEEIGARCLRFNHNGQVLVMVLLRCVILVDKN